MKRALTLIELIFTIVIIGFVFSVIPRIIYISNESLKFSKKEDAIFSMMAKMMDISLKEFDENNTLVDYILLVNDPPKYVLDCNASSGYRVGGFVGSRSCKNYFVSNIGKDANEPPYDDVDDYNGTKEEISYGHTSYTLKIVSGYTDEWRSYGDKSLEFNFSSRMDNNKSNIKRVYVYVFSDENISSVSYYSANIGHIKINKVRW